MKKKGKDTTMHFFRKKGGKRGENEGEGNKKKKMG